MIFQISPKIIHFSRKVQALCLAPYPKHPKGCPNYGNKRSLNGIRKDLKSRVIRECPKNGRLIDQILDFSKPVSIIITYLKSEKMLKKEESPALT